jgi:cobalt-zinc-cadmium efflux system membrane fusion protein
MTKSIPARQLTKKLLVAALVTVSSIAIIYFFTTSTAKTALVTPVAPTASGVVSFADHDPKLSSIAIVTAQLEAMPVSEPLFGRITYNENHTTRISSPVAGRVVALLAEVGDQVRRAQVLAELDAPDLGTAEADWQKARADQVRKQHAFDRAKVLFDGEVLAKKDFESAQADIEQARSETRRTVLRMRNLNAAGGQNGIFRLKATLSGTVAERQINPGQEVRPDLPVPLFVITNLDTLWVIADVPELVANNIHAGQLALVESEAWSGERFNAKVDRVGIMLDPATRRVQIRCTVQNQAHRLKPEMFVRLSFLPQENAVQAVELPNTSLFVEGLYSYVYVQTHPGTYEKRRVSVLRTGSIGSFIDSGIVSGEKVVTEGAFLLNAEAGSDAH